jgi:hypothetical protein
MRAAVLFEIGAPPVAAELGDPWPVDGHEVAEVIVAGLNLVDLYIAFDGDYAWTLSEAAGNGYDVVVDPIYGAPLERIGEAWERQAQRPHHEIAVVP